MVPCSGCYTGGVAVAGAGHRGDDLASRCLSGRGHMERALQEESLASTTTAREEVAIHSPFSWERKRQDQRWTWNGSGFVMRIPVSTAIIASRLVPSCQTKPAHTHARELTKPEIA